MFCMQTDRPKQFEQLQKQPVFNPRETDSQIKNRLQRFLYPDVASSLVQIGQKTRHGRGPLPNNTLSHFQRTKQHNILNYVMSQAFTDASKQHLTRLGVTPYNTLERNGSFWSRGSSSHSFAAQLDPDAFKKQITRMHVPQRTSYIDNNRNKKMQTSWDADMMAQRAINFDHMAYEALLIASGSDLCKSVAMLPKDMKYKDEAWYGPHDVGLLLDLTSAEHRGMVHHISDTNTYSGPGFPFAPACGIDTKTFPDVGYNRARQKMVNPTSKNREDAWSFSEINMDIDADSVLGVLFRTPVYFAAHTASEVYSMMNELSHLGKKIADTYGVHNFLGVFYVIDPKTNKPVRLYTYNDVKKYFPDRTWKNDLFR